MKFERPSDPEALGAIEGTVIIPSADCEYPDDLSQRYISRSHRGASDAVTVPLFEAGDGYVDLDVEGLMRLVWEHQQYSAAQEFSVSHLEVLRAVQELSEDTDRILFRDITARVEYADSTVSQALGRLADRELVKKLADGVYSYRGFEELGPDPTQGSELGESTGIER